MQKLRPVLDAARAADEKVGQVMSEMLAAFEEGTEEGKQRALDLRGALDQAKAEAQEANDLYVSMRDAAVEENEHARKFVPAEGAKPERQAKEISRAEYEALDYAERHAFLSAGGSIVENPVE